MCLDHTVYNKIKVNKSHLHKAIYVGILRIYGSVRVLFFFSPDLEEPRQESVRRHASTTKNVQLQIQQPAGIQM